MWRTMLNRLKEPSTMAGMAVLLGLFGVPAAPEMVQGAGMVLTGVAGLLAVLLPESQK
jgi:hypothetical protein